MDDWKKNLKSLMAFDGSEDYVDTTNLIMDLSHLPENKLYTLIQYQEIVPSESV